MTITSDSKGFTLVEVAVILAILGILAAIAIPAIVQALPNIRLRSFAYDYLATLQRARGLAIQENRSVAVTVDGNGFHFVADMNEDGDYDDDDDKVKTGFDKYGSVAEGKGKATVDWEGNSGMSVTNTFTFSNRGTATSGTVYFDNGMTGDKNQICYAVTVVTTGFMQVRKYVPCDAANEKNCWLD